MHFSCLKACFMRHVWWRLYAWITNPPPNHPSHLPSCHGIHYWHYITLTQMHSPVQQTMLTWGSACVCSVRGLADRPSHPFNFNHNHMRAAVSRSRSLSVCLLSLIREKQSALTCWIWHQFNILSTLATVSKVSPQLGHIRQEDLSPCPAICLP